MWSDLIIKHQSNWLFFSSRYGIINFLMSIWWIWLCSLKYFSWRMNVLLKVNSRFSGVAKWIAFSGSHAGKWAPVQLIAAFTFHPQSYPWWYNYWRTVSRELWCSLNRPWFLQVVVSLWLDCAFREKCQNMFFGKLLPFLSIWGEIFQNLFWTSSTYIVTYNCISRELFLLLCCNIVFGIVFAFLCFCLCLGCCGPGRLPQVGCMLRMGQWTNWLAKMLVRPVTLDDT